MIEFYIDSTYLLNDNFIKLLRKINDINLYSMYDNRIDFSGYGHIGFNDSYGNIFIFLEDLPVSFFICETYSDSEVFAAYIDGNDNEYTWSIPEKTGIEKILDWVKKCDIGEVEPD